ncbi:MAG: hypothetical protein CTY15_05015 [Methylocystis sp.]|nr:MAG: hypothetical protein CTY15_05015 [Methylocystis sp.]
MATKMEIQTALAHLEAGKFSFRMVDAIKDHVATLEGELSGVSALHAGAVKDLANQEYANARLEAELRKVNARMYALMKANALTEIAVRETSRGAVMLRDYASVAGKQSVEFSKKALAYLAKLDVQSEVEKARSHPMTQKALREMQPALVKAKEYLPVVKKQVAATVEKATAYIATLNKKAA